MNTRNLLTVSAVVSFLFAAGSLLMPNTIGPMYGFGTSPAENLLGRFFGVGLLTVGAINWLVRDTDYAALRPVLLGNLVGDVAGLIVAVMGTLSGAMNSLGWTSAAIYLLFALGYAYFYFMGQPVSVRQRA